jgi:hypothetical protein
MQGFFRKYSYVVPQVQLAAAFVASFIDFEAGSMNLYRLGHAVGYSVFTGLVYVAYFCRKSFNVATQICSVGLLVISVYNLIGSFIPYDTYDKWFDRVVFTFVWLIVLVRYFKIKK